MDVNTESLKSEIDPIASTDSLQIITDEFSLQHLSIPEMTNTELSKHIATLELDNQRLRINLENARIELNAKNAANQGLKNKIAELCIQAQISLQEKQKLHNSVKDAQFQLTSAENSTKWYQSQMYEVQASKKTLQIEVNTYQNMLKQKHQTLVNITSKWKQLNEDYLLLVQKHKKEKDILQEEIKLLKMKDHTIKSCSLQSQVQSTVSMTIYNELSGKLEIAEEQLQNAHAELHSLELRLTNAETERISTETACSKQNTLLSLSEDSLKRCQSECIELKDIVREMCMELKLLKSENETLQTNLLLTQQERGQVEYAIDQLRSQLTKMILQHKLLRNRNAQLEKLNIMQDICNKNIELKSLSYPANTSFLRKLKQEKQKTSNMQRHFDHEQNKETFDKILKEQLKSVKIFEESFDEGYADCNSVASFPVTNLPSPRPLKPEILKTISDVLLRSENFWEEIQLGLQKLQLKFEKYKGEQIPGSSSCYDTLQLSIPSPSPASNTRCIA